LALLSAYALVTNGKLTSIGRAGTALNVAGSAGLAVNAGAHSAWPSLVLNLIWLAIAGRAFGQELRRRSPVRTC
jgi:hypothetical protein